MKTIFVLGAGVSTGVAVAAWFNWQPFTPLLILGISAQVVALFTPLFIKGLRW